MPTSPVPVPAGPAVPDSGNTEATFDAQWEAFNAWVTNDLQPGVNALAVNVKSNADEAALSAIAAAAQALIATLQANAAASSALTAGAIAWVSNTTYAIGNARYSLIDGQTYRRLTAGAGTTDPSQDAVNWRVINGLVNQAVSIPVNNLPSIRPTLNLNFAGGQTVDPRITFTRASAATRINARGLIEAVASGVPRIHFDPVTLACRGFLIEAQRANLMTYSEQFDNAAWVKTRATITANATTAPDGNLTADKLVSDSSASNTHFVEGTTALVSGTVYTYSKYFKAGELSQARLTVFSNVSHTCFFDLSSVTANSPSNCTAVIDPFGNGWFECSITFTSGVTGSAFFDTYLMSGGTNSYTGDGTSGLYIWGAQLEAGEKRTSYIPTVASQVTRAADLPLMSGTNFSSWYNALEGTFVISSTESNSTTGFPRKFAVSDGTANNLIQVLTIGSSDSLLYSITAAGVGQVSQTALSGHTGQSTVTAISYKLNDSASSVNGSAALVDSACTVPSGMTSLRLGVAFDGSEVINGHIQSLCYYPKRLTNAELQALSTQ